jgi:hypothetical protein
MDAHPDGIGPSLQIVTDQCAEEKVDSRHRTWQLISDVMLKETRSRITTPRVAQRDRKYTYGRDKFDRGDSK